MAINFPASPNIDDTHSASGKTWKYDGTSWNLVIASTSVGDAGAKGQKGEKADDAPQEFDMFWLAVVSSVTQNGNAYNNEVIGDGNTRTGNMGRVTSAGFAVSGSGMSENNGVFNFPTTGQWSVKSEVFGYGRSSIANNTDFTVRINYSSDGGSSWTDVSQSHTITSTDTYPELSHSSQEYIFNITDLAQQQVRFMIDSNNAMQIDYPSGQPSRFIFHKLEGMIGQKGIDGDKGIKGEVGQKGIQGLEGDQGDAGTKGEKGIQSTVPGSKGDKGETGADSTVAGPKGETGDKGDIGDKGQKGATGTVASSASFTNLNVTGISTLGGTGIGNTVGIGSTAYFGDGGIKLQGVLTGRTSGNKIRINSHIIPEANAQYDLGNAEYKIRHLFLSDNSIKFVKDGSEETYSISVTAGGNSAYQMSGNDKGGSVSGDNPTIDVQVGDVIEFAVNAAGHPMWISDTQGTGSVSWNNAWGSCTNNGGESTTITWDTTNAAVGTYYYNCEYHGSMTGVVNITSGSSGVTKTLSIDNENLIFDGKQVLGNVVLSGIDNNDTLSWNGSNWVNVPPSGSPGGSANQLQYNDGSGFAGSNLKYSANLDGSLEWTNAGGTSGARISCYHDTISGGDNSMIFYAGGGMLGTLNMRIFNNSVTVYGALTKGSGSFRIPHPLAGLSTTKDLVHSFIEGPQCDNIYRGKIDLVGGTATVNLDTKSDMTAGTFVALNRDVQCFTTNESGWTAVKGSVSGNTLTITAQDNSCTDTISWMVIGERQDDNIKSSSLTDATGKLIMEPNQIPLPPTS